MSLRKTLRRISAVLGVSGIEINFIFVTDRVIRRYNKKYLHHDDTTDVIAFPMEEGGVLGDILISTDTAKRQAREQGHTLLTELKILAIHGLLHLRGYRDKKKKDRERMWRKTDQLLRQVEEIR